MALQIEGVDFSELENSGLSKEALEALSGKIGKRLKDFHGNMTKKEQEAAEYRKQAEAAKAILPAYATWEKIRAENPHLFNGSFTNIANALRRLGQSPDEIVTRLSSLSEDSPSLSPGRQGQQQAAEQEAYELVRLAQGGEIEWDDAKKGLSAIASRVRGFDGNLNAIKGIVESASRKTDEVQTQMARIHTQTQNQLANSIKLNAEIAQFCARNPNRDVNPVIATMGQYGCDFNNAVRVVYGAEDLETATQKRIADEIQKEKQKWEEEERTKFSPEGNGERGAMAHRVFRLRSASDNKMERPLPGHRNDAAFVKSVNDKISRVARSL